MSIKSVRTILEKAQSDGEFRKNLLSDPDLVLKDFELTDAEIARFKKMRPESLDAIKNNLDRRYSKDGSVNNVDDDWWVESVTD